MTLDDRLRRHLYGHMHVCPTCGTMFPCVVNHRQGRDQRYRGGIRPGLTISDSQVVRMCRRADKARHDTQTARMAEAPEAGGHRMITGTLRRTTTQGHPAKVYSRIRYGDSPGKPFVEQSYKKP